MSRRHSSRTRQQPLPWDDVPQAHWSEVSWWYDPIPGFEPYTWSEWQDAWAEVTLEVVWAVWRRTGASLYAVQRDALLREDLQSWLSLQAQVIAGNFMPSPWHPAPERQWGAFLTRGLERAARWHFRQVVGRREEDQAAYNIGITSTDYLDELADAEGVRVHRRPLHGDDLMYLNPLDIMIRAERLTEDVITVEHIQREQGTYSTATTNGICIETGCGRPIHGRDLCKNHYQQHRYLWGDGTGKTCIEPGCQIPAFKRGRCGSHYKTNRLKKIAAGTWEPTQPTVGCIEPGCQEPHTSKGRCRLHYDAYRRSLPRPPCSEEGCEKPSGTRGMCPMHYQRWRKNRAAQKKGGTQ